MTYLKSCLKQTLKLCFLTVFYMEFITDIDTWCTIAMKKNTRGKILQCCKCLINTISVLHGINNND